MHDRCLLALPVHIHHKCVLVGLERAEGRFIPSPMVRHGRIGHAAGAPRRHLASPLHRPFQCMPPVPLLTIVLECGVGDLNFPIALCSRARTLDTCSVHRVPRVSVHRYMLNPRHPHILVPIRILLFRSSLLVIEEFLLLCVHFLCGRCGSLSGTIPHGSWENCPLSFFIVEPRLPLSACNSANLFHVLIGAGFRSHQRCIHGCAWHHIVGGLAPTFLPQGPIFLQRRCTRKLWC